MKGWEWHYDQAELLLERAGDKDLLYGHEQRKMMVSQAQVHALLAQMLTPETKAVS